MFDYYVRLVKSFVEAIDKLSLALHEHADSVRANAKATRETQKKQAEQPILPSSISVNLDKAVAVSIQGESKTQVCNTWDCRDYLRLGAELVGLLVLIWYACTTNGLWVESRNQTKLAEQQNRPWIGSPEIDMSLRPDQRRLVFQNLGHLPTYGLYINAGSLSGKDTVATKEIEDFCDTAARQAKNKSERFVFFSIIAGQKYALSQVADLNGEKLLNVGRIGEDGRDFGGCVVYGWPDLKHLHQTGFLMQFRTSGNTHELIGSYPINPN